jgi:hypothetical protein
MTLNFPRECHPAARKRAKGGKNEYKGLLVLWLFDLEGDVPEHSVPLD